jgi:type II secretory pathway pseudopilin PulG
MQRTKLVIVLTLLAVLGLSACSGSEESTPTVSVEQIQTLAVMTYQAQLTQTALAMPTSTPLPTDTPVPVATFPISSGSPAAINTTAAGGSSSCYGLTYVRDVTIPDNTEVTPGQSFTKTWLVSNSGTCAWEAGFIFNIVSGEAMGGTSLTLDQTVEPGRQYEFSVPMVAPSDTTGELKGTWRLSDANGNFFGDGVYVLVDVGAAATAAPTNTPTATSTNIP